ncbi:uncharacterized protein [Amphiura filiformis]|uniref:uncharacterized protein n=1 Tax=Amphiura filiformis TaxID=82378 RepID=UPI003B2169C5
MSELTSKKQTDSEVGEELPPDLAMLQESVGMGKPAAPVTVEIRKLSAFVPVSTQLSYQNQDSHTKVVVKQLPVSTGHKPNLPLIRNPTKTIPIPQDFVKKLLCKEKLDEPTPDTKVSESIFISTKPVNPALVQTGKSPEPATDHSRKEIVKTSPPTVSTSSSMPKAATEPLTGASSMKPNLPPFQPISVENKHKRSPSPQTTSTQASSPCGTSPPFSRCSSLGSVGELDRTLSTDSQVSARCRSKSVSPNAQVIQAGNPIETSSRTLLINSKINVSVSSPINATTIPNTIQTCMITTAGATVATPVRLGLPMPITRMTTLIPGTSIPAVRQSSIGQFMSMSSVLPPYPAGHLPMPSTLCNTMHPCISTTTTCVPTTNHLVSPQYTSTSTPAGLITPTSSAQGTNDINFYRTPTTLPFGSVQPKAFFNSQALGMPTGTPYVLSGVGGAIGQLQPVSRRLTLALPPSSQH